MKFSELKCVGTKKICGKFCCKYTSTQKVIVLVFI